MASRKKDHKYLVFFEEEKKKNNRSFQRCLNRKPFLLRYRNNYKKMHNRNKYMTTRKRNRSATIGVRIIKIL